MAGGESKKDLNKKKSVQARENTYVLVDEGFFSVGCGCWLERCVFF